MAELPSVGLKEAKEKYGIVGELDRLLTEKRDPKEFLEPLGQLLDNTPQKSNVLSDDIALYRARRVDENKPFFSDVADLGPPKVSGKNRLNDEQDPVLYAAFTPYTAAAEIRGRTREVLAIAKIAPRPGHGDLMRFFPLGLPGGRYASPIRGEADRIVLDYIGREMTKAVSDDPEHKYKYNSTIAIAHKFLRTGLTGTTTPYDTGIIYPSAQIGLSCNDDYFCLATTPASYSRHYHIVEVTAIIANPISTTQLDSIILNRATIRGQALDWEHKTFAEMRAAHPYLADIMRPNPKE
ncbi:MAG: RES family NAD+ phosphorylase [Gammaproteobacteria bacterium]|nr:RES family NAD+ phosphorylase [Gammaproteobacteria bacterium]